MSESPIAKGVLAGAAGTAFLNAVTYADMALRGRPPSELPEKMVQAIAQVAGLRSISKPQEALTEQERHRRTGIGALIGYADGLGVGAMYGLIRPAMRQVPWFWSGVGLAAITMLVSEGIATAMHQTDPREWGLGGWLADIVPRCFYGWVTAITYDRLLGGA